MSVAAEAEGGEGKWETVSFGIRDPRLRLRLRFLEVILTTDLNIFFYSSSLSGVVKVLERDANLNEPTKERGEVSGTLVISDINHFSARPITLVGLIDGKLSPFIKINYAVNLIRPIG